ncbi:MAG: hypothetical protein ABFS21_03015 [Actinomycetota bacterium]
MKPFLIFVAGLVVVFGAFAVITNLIRDTERVFVVVDSSFPMTEVWSQVPGALSDIDDQRFSEFALATEKELVHTWSDSLQLGSTTPFAPCDFSEVSAYSEIGEADDLVLITTSSSCSTEAFATWRVIVLES